MTDDTGRTTPRVYWHRDLPPLEAEIIEEHTLEATSSRVPGSLDHHERDERWHECYEQLKAAAEARLVQELQRLGGDCAHVFAESVDSRRDDAAAEGWLAGRFDYMLYRLPRS
jgi:hypothetical protein